MKTPTAMTCSAHRWIHRGRLRGHTSKSATATRRDLFAIVPLGLAAVASSAMTWGYSAPRN
jgi:hypothetical protein